jgi:hypothetical protein
MTDTEILDYIEKHFHTFEITKNYRTGKFLVLDGPASNEHTETLGTGDTLRQAVTNAFLEPYGNHKNQDPIVEYKPFYVDNWGCNKVKGTPSNGNY